MRIPTKLLILMLCCAGMGLAQSSRIELVEGNGWKLYKNKYIYSIRYEEPGKIPFNIKLYDPASPTTSVEELSSHHEFADQNRLSETRTKLWGVPAIEVEFAAGSQQTVNNWRGLLWYAATGNGQPFAIMCSQYQSMRTDADLEDWNIQGRALCREALANNIFIDGVPAQKTALGMRSNAPAAPPTAKSLGAGKPRAADAPAGRLGAASARKTPVQQSPEEAVTNAIGRAKSAREANQPSNAIALLTTVAQRSDLPANLKRKVVAELGETRLQAGIADPQERTSLCTAAAGDLQSSVPPVTSWNREEQEAQLRHYLRVGEAWECADQADKAIAAYRQVEAGDALGTYHGPFYSAAVIRITRVNLNRAYACVSEAGGVRNHSKCSAEISALKSSARSTDLWARRDDPARSYVLAKAAHLDYLISNAPRSRKEALVAARRYLAAEQNGPEADDMRQLVSKLPAQAIHLERVGLSLVLPEDENVNWKVEYPAELKDYVYLSQTVAPNKMNVYLHRDGSSCEEWYNGEIGHYRGKEKENVTDANRPPYFPNRVYRRVFKTHLVRTWFGVDGCFDSNGNAIAFEISGDDPHWTGENPPDLEDLVDVQVIKNVLQALVSAN